MGRGATTLTILLAVLPSAAFFSGCGSPGGDTNRDITVSEYYDLLQPVCDDEGEAYAEAAAKYLAIGSSPNLNSLTLESLQEGNGVIDRTNRALVRSINRFLAEWPSIEPPPEIREEVQSIRAVLSSQAKDRENYLAAWGDAQKAYQQFGFLRPSDTRKLEAALSGRGVPSLPKGTEVKAFGEKCFNMLYPVGARPSFPQG